MRSKSDAKSESVPQGSAQKKHVRRIDWLVVWLFITTFLFSLTLIFKVPFLTQVHSWSYPISDKPLPGLLLSALLAGVVGYAWSLAGDRKWPVMCHLFILYVLGVGMHFGFAFQEQRGIDGLKDRITKTGHAEFARIAVEYDSPIQVAGNYESLLQANRLGMFAQSKPPGTLLFYMATQKLAAWIHPESGPSGRLEWLRTFSAYFWPWVSFLAVIPFYLTAREFLSEKTSLLAVLLYLAIPSVQLITLHTDGVIFPTLFLLVTWLSSIAARERSLILAFLAGVTTYVAVYFTFGLGGAGIAGLMLMAFVLLRASESRDKTVLSFVRLALAFGFGALALGTIVWAATDYDLFLRYQRAIAFHSWWKRYSVTPYYVIYSSLLNFTEFAMWLGLPVVFLAFAAFGRSIEAIRNTEFDQRVGPSIVFLTLLIFNLLFGKTLGESPRLWLFFVPLGVMAAAGEILLRLSEHARFAFTILIAIQLTLVSLMKAYMDFR